MEIDLDGNPVFADPVITSPEVIIPEVSSPWHPDITPGFVYREDMWDEMYASVGGYEAYVEKGGVIETTDGEIYTWRPTTEDEIQAAAAMPVDDTYFQQSTEAYNAVIEQGNQVAAARIEAGITQLGVPQPIYVPPQPQPVYEYRRQGTNELLEYTRDDVHAIVKILRGLDLPISGSTPEFTQQEIVELILYLRGNK